MFIYQCCVYVCVCSSSSRPHVCYWRAAVCFRLRGFRRLPAVVSLLPLMPRRMGWRTAAPAGVTRSGTLRAWTCSSPKQVSLCVTTAQNQPTEAPRQTKADSDYDWHPEAIALMRLFIILFIYCLLWLVMLFLTLKRHADYHCCLVYHSARGRLIINAKNLASVCYIIK